MRGPARDGGRRLIPWPLPNTVWRENRMYVLRGKHALLHALQEEIGRGCRWSTFGRVRLEAFVGFERTVSYPSGLVSFVLGREKDVRELFHVHMLWPFG